MNHDLMGASRSLHGGDRKERITLQGFEIPFNHWSSNLREGFCNQGSDTYIGFGKIIDNNMVRFMVL